MARPLSGQGFEALPGGAESALGGHDIPDGFWGAHSTGVIVSFQNAFHAAGALHRGSCLQGWSWRPAGDFSYSLNTKTVGVVFPQEVKGYL